MHCVTALYPSQEGGTFDFDYYLETHIPLTLGFVGDNLIRWEVHRGTGKAAYVCRTSFWVHSLERFQQMLAAHQETIFGDVPNYTNLKPELQVEEVMGSGAVEGHPAGRSGR